MEHDTGLVV